MKKSDICLCFAMILGIQAVPSVNGSDCFLLDEEQEEEEEFEELEELEELEEPKLATFKQAIMTGNNDLLLGELRKTDPESLILSLTGSQEGTITSASILNLHYNIFDLCAENGLFSFFENCPDNILEQLAIATLIEQLDIINQGMTKIEKMLVEDILKEFKPEEKLLEIHKHMIHELEWLLEIIYTIFPDWKKGEEKGEEDFTSRFTRKFFPNIRDVFMRFRTELENLAKRGQLDPEIKSEILKGILVYPRFNTDLFTAGITIHTKANFRDFIESPLEVATRKGHLEIVKNFVEKYNPDINKANGKGRTLLHSASAGGYLPVVEFLVRHHANVNQADFEGDAPLQLASKDKQYLPVLKFLVRHGANVNQTSSWWSLTALQHASKGGNMPGIEYLIRHGADVNYLSKFLRITPLQIASYSGDLPMVKFLVEHGANVNQADTQCRTPLLFASQRGDLPMVKFLVEHGAKVNESDYPRPTPLLEATQRGDLPMVEFLVEHGANVNASNEDGQSPLLEASYSGNLPIVKFLVEHGAKVDQPNDRGLTPLGLAKSRDIEVFLRQHGAEHTHLYIVKRYIKQKKEEEEELE